MKKLLLLFAIAFSFHQGHAQISNTDSFVHELFSSLKTKDQKRFLRLFPDAAQFKKMLQGLMQEYSANDTASLKKGMAMLNDITDSSLQQQFAVQYKEAMEKSEAAGIDWSHANFISYKADTTIADDIKGKQLKGTIYFSINKQQYFLVFGEVLWPDTHSGWMGVAIKEISEGDKHEE